MAVHKCIECKRKVMNRKLCNTCSKRKYRLENPVKDAYYNLKNSAKKRGIEFTLTFKQFEKFCIKTDYIVKKGIHKTGYGVDRKDVTKGYTASNIQCLTNSQNAQKRHLEYVHGYPVKTFKWITQESFSDYDDVPF